MVGGPELHNWWTLFVLIPCMLDSICGVCGRVWIAWWHLRDPLATRAGPAKPRMGSQKSKQKSPGTVSRHPPLYLSHTSKFNHNHRPLKKQIALCICNLVVSSAAHGGQKRILGRTKSRGCPDKKQRYFCDAASPRVGSNCRTGERSHKDQSFRSKFKFSLKEWLN